MIFPLDFEDLIVLYAVMAIVLLITSELLSSYHSKTKISIDRKRLRIVSIVFSVLFLVTVGLRVYEIFLTI